MIIDPVVFYLIAATSMLISGAFLVLAIAYTKILKKSVAKEKELDSQRAIMRERAMALVTDAREKSLKIIEDANKTAAGIIEQATITSQFSEKELGEKLKAIQEEQSEKLKEQTSDFLAQFHATLENLKQEDVASLQSASQQIQTQALSQVDAFKHSIEEETVESEQKIAQEMEKQYSVVKQELETYKQKKMKQIDDSIYTILMFVTKEILGKSLNIEDQEELVRKTLDEAKKKGDFEHV